jgi:hypothetical protein
MEIEARSTGRLRASIEENARLQALSSAQSDLLDDLRASSTIEEDSLPILEQQIAAMDGAVQRSQRQLSPLTASPPPASGPDVGPGLKALLTDVQTQVLMMCVKSVKAGFLSVPITALVDLEQQITAYEDAFASDGLLEKSESPEAEEHMDRIMSFLSAVHRREILPNED